MINNLSPELASSAINLQDVLNLLPHGLTITDARGIIVYYNDVQAEIDDLRAEDVIGRHITEVYVPSPENSPTLAALRTGQAIYDFFMIYETNRGRLVNSTHTSLPLLKDGEVIGCVCLISRVSSPAGPAERSGQKALESVQFGNLIGNSLAFRASINAAMAAADTPSSVLIYGETGAGKELLARQLHEHSQRSAKPYVAINCSAIPATLLEGTLFGSVKGSFTGSQNTPGLFEEADGGTIYLDEVDSMPIDLQPKLLRVIQERRVRRIGAIKEVPVDIKLISSFSCDPFDAVRNNRVRADLFYRLGVVIVQIPPLRDRTGDLPGLVSFLINKHTSILKKRTGGLAPEVMSIFKNYDWPGNVRQLENVIEGALNMIQDGGLIQLNHLPPYLRQAGSGSSGWYGGPRGGGGWLPPFPPPLRAGRDDFPPAFFPADQPDQPDRPWPDKLSREDLAEALTHSRGSLKIAAARLGLSRQLLAYHLKKHGLDRRRFKTG